MNNNPIENRSRRAILKKKRDHQVVIGFQRIRKISMFRIQ